LCYQGGIKSWEEEAELELSDPRVAVFLSVEFFRHKKIQQVYCPAWQHFMHHSSFAGMEERSC
jgi:hypothetical protein